MTYHDVEWTPERIQRFWNFMGANQAAHESYFSRQVGDGIIRVVRQHAQIRGLVVDLGCGPGYLLERLLQQGFTCKGLDSSAEAIAQVQRRFAGRVGFLGAQEGSLDPIPLADGEAGALFLIETLEHLSPDFSKRALAEIRRVIRPGGHLILTVPNAENLDLRKIVCPECGCVFHRVQHMQQFDRQSLSDLLQDNQLEMVFAAGLNFQDFSGNLLNQAVGVLRRLKAAVRPRIKPHLIAIARRTG